MMIIFHNVPAQARISQILRTANVRLPLSEGAVELVEFTMGYGDGTGGVPAGFLFVLSITGGSLPSFLTVSPASPSSSD
jgi:hypothetical protein